MVKVAWPVVSLSPHLGRAAPRPSAEECRNCAYAPPAAAWACVFVATTTVHSMCAKVADSAAAPRQLRCNQDGDGCLDEQALRFTYGLPDYVLLTHSHSLTFSRRTLLAPLYLLVYDCAYCGCTHYDAQAFCMAMHLAASRAEAPAQVRLYSREMREAVREALLYLAVGAEVTVRGLESRPDLDGATARVQRWDAQTGRRLGPHGPDTVEMLQLASGVKPAAADTSKALKPKNLKPADVP